MQNILHARIVCVYFGFKSMNSYVEDGREVSKIIYVQKKEKEAVFISPFSCYLDELSNDV